MQEQYQWGFRPVAQQSAEQVALQQNRVLRNTYLMLALTMVPTVIGALIGVQLNFSFFAGSPLISFLLFLGIAFGFFWGIEKTKNSLMGVVLPARLHVLHGPDVRRILQVALGFSNGGTMIAMAAGGTGAIFFTLAGIASTISATSPASASSLFVGVVVLLLAALASVFFQIRRWR